MPTVHIDTPVPDDEPTQRMRVPPMQIVRENPRTVAAILLSVVLTGGGAGFLNRFFPPDYGEAKAAAAQSDPQVPLILYRLEQIEKRLEKLEKGRR